MNELVAPSTPSEGASTASVSLRARFSDFAALTKPRITAMVVLTAAVGYWMGVSGAVDGWILFHALLGTGLSAAGACALNMLMEREGDARMRRTRTRPLPAGRIRPREALFFGLALTVGGVLWLTLGVGWVAGGVSALITLGYLFAYTPLKPVSSLSTLVGAQVGAAPPLIGWFAARGDLGLGGWILFAIIVFWQWPHILSMAWMNREDLIKVNYPLAPVFEGSGRRAGRQMVVGCLALLGVSLVPFFAGMAGLGYLIAAVALGGAFAASGLAFAARRTEPNARRVFLASLLYLPVLLSFLVLAKI